MLRPSNPRVSCLILSLNACNVLVDTARQTSQHLVFLIGEMRASVNRARSTLIAEMQGDEGAADCLIWRNASKEYKRQAIDLDDQMRELIVLAKVANRMLKEVIRVCNRGERKALYEQGATLEITPDFALSG